MTKGTKATVYYNGKVKWEPPASFKSSCDINVKYFPFDEQYCKLKFGSWTYDKTEVSLYPKILSLFELGSMYNAHVVYLSRST